MTKAKILVIDDDETILRLLKAMLGNKGYEVITAPGPSQGLEMASQAKPDLIILDIYMEPVDGLQVLSDLRNTPAMEKTPVLMLSTADTIKSINMAFDLGANDYLPKPINSFHLLKKIVKLLAPANSLPGIRP